MAGRGESGSPDDIQKKHVARTPLSQEEEEWVFNVTRAGKKEEGYVSNAEVVAEFAARFQGRTISPRTVSRIRNSTEPRVAQRRGCKRGQSYKKSRTELTDAENLWLFSATHEDSALSNAEIAKAFATLFGRPISESTVSNIRHSATPRVSKRKAPQAAAAAAQKEEEDEQEDEEEEEDDEEEEEEEEEDEDEVQEGKKEKEEDESKKRKN
jgi:TATA-binding protein-associated factor Taf7